MVAAAGARPEGDAAQDAPPLAPPGHGGGGGGGSGSGGGATSTTEDGNNSGAVPLPPGARVVVSGAGATTPTPTPSTADSIEQMYAMIATQAPAPAPASAPAPTPVPLPLAPNANVASLMHATGVGTSMSSTFPPFRATYNDMGELRRELKVLSVQLNLPYYMHHSSPQRLEARCPAWKTRKEQDVTCGFVVSANRHTNGKIYVTRASLSHAPGCTAVQARGNHISAAALMETAKPMIKKMSEENLKPRDMANMIKEQFGVSTSYMTAWRALSSLRQSKKAEENASFMKIRGYLDLFVSHNEGSYAVFEHRTGTHIFARAFLCPKPLQAIPKYCRSALLLSVFLVTSTHGGVVMTVTAQDALGEKIPLAVGVVPEENEAEWTFFLTHLHKAIPDMERSITTLVHNRGEELQQAIQAVFPTCVQSNQVESFFSILPNQQASSGVQVDPIVQWMETLCAKTPLMILVGWVSKIASTLYQRFEKYRSMTSEYPEDFQTLLLQYDAEASRYDVVRVAEHGFEVIDHESGRQRVVDFSKQSCSCGEYDASKFPCLHVYLAISFAGLMQADFIPKIFLMSSLKSLYGGRITPIDVETVPVDQVTTPNPVQKTRGRPRKVQQIQQFGGSKLERLACSVCGVKGHNKRTCKRFVVPPEAAPITIGAALQEPDVEVTEEPTFLDHTYEEDLHCDITALTGSAVQVGAQKAQADDDLFVNADSEAPSTKKRRTASDAADGEQGSDPIPI